MLEAEGCRFQCLGLVLLLALAALACSSGQGKGSVAGSQAAAAGTGTGGNSAGGSTNPIEGSTWSAAEILALDALAARYSAPDTSPQVATDGTGTWLAVWDSEVDLDLSIGSDFDIQFGRSTDGGLSWSPPLALNTNAATDSGDDLTPAIASDGAGTWVVVWDSDDDLGGTIGSDADILVARSTDAGLTWSAPAALDPDADIDTGMDVLPQIASDGAGGWIAVWQSTDDLGGTIGSDWDVLVSRSSDGGLTWTPAVALNGNAAVDTGDDESPQIRSNGAGVWLASWQSTDSLGGTIGVDADILVARSTDFGASWSAPAPLNTNAATDAGNDLVPQLETDGFGTWLAVWESTDSLGGTIFVDRDILVARSLDDGLSWNPPAALNSDAVDPVINNQVAPLGDEFSPDIVTNGAGLWVAVWDSTAIAGTGAQGTGEDKDIFTARSTDGGLTWTTRAPLYTGARTDEGDDQRARITSDGSTWLAVWESDDDVGRQLCADGDVLSSRSANGSTFTQPRAISGCNTGSDLAAQVTSDRQGTWIAVWESAESMRTSIGADRDVLFSRSTDDGNSWSDPATLNDDAHVDSDDDRWPQLATDFQGNWVAVWARVEDAEVGAPPGAFSIRVSRSTDDGVSWSPGSTISARIRPGDLFPAVFPRIATDGAGTWLAVWWSQVGLNGDRDIQYSRSTDAGLTWSLPALLNTNAGSDSGDDLDPTIATDGTTWVVAWDSDDDLGGTLGSDRDVLVARSTDGGLTWSDPAPLNSDAASDVDGDLLPDLSTDGAGVWVAAWAVEVGVQRFNLVSRSIDAGLSWSAPASLSGAAGDDFRPSLANDGGNTWIAVWHSEEDVDGSGTDFDVFESRSLDRGISWSTPRAFNSNAPDDQRADLDPHVDSDHAGHWVAIWSTTDSLGQPIGDDYDLVVSRDP